MGRSRLRFRRWREEKTKSLGKKSASSADDELGLGSQSDKFSRITELNWVQLKTEKHLPALLGILGVIATELLKLRNFSGYQTDRSAEETIAKKIVVIVKNKYKIDGEISLKELW